MHKSDLPFGSEFSPSQIALPAILRLVQEHAGQPRALESAIMQRFFPHHGRGSEQNRRTLALNCRLGLRAYGIIDDNAYLTAFGRDLLAASSDEGQLYDRLAKYILLNLKGMALVQCIKDMHAAGEVVNLTSLRDALAVRGIHYPPGGKHPSIMRLWLAKAGVFRGARWDVDDAALERILGVSSAAFSALQDLSREQRAFLLALANTGIAEPQSASDIVKLAAATYGVKFPEKSLPKLVLNALTERGFITITKTTAGRGAKPFLVAPTPRAHVDIITPLLHQSVPPGNARLLDLLQQPMQVILHNLSSTSKHARGLALEALAFKLMRLIDMRYVTTRLRGNATGGAEVDLIFESERLVYSRWQVQCKNTSRMSLDDVAKEVGLTHLLKSNVVIMICTGDIGSEARRYANTIMRESHLCIVMLDRADLQRITASPAAIVDCFNREAHHAMTLKKLVLD